MELKYKQTILDLNINELESFLLSKESYFSLNLPSYFDFENMLKEYIKVYEKNIEYIEKKILEAKKIENLNHIIFANIDNRINWRKFQIIKPILYIFLVKIISKTEYYNELNNYFITLDNNISENAESYSLQRLPEKNKKLAGTQINEWYENIEKRSIQLVLEYKYLLIADIADFYNSIYTHSIPWALQGKEKAKKNRNKDNLGNKLDKIFQALNYGQTNGIPTGNSISDFISEIILRKIDQTLTQKLESKNIKYKILRYRDDYRIFTNSQEDGENILKILSEILLEFGLSLNSQKTIICSDIILNSLKNDKIEGINSIFYYILDSKIYLEKYKFSYLYYSILSLYNFSRNYPNSGTLQKLLYKTYEFLSKNQNKNILNKIKEKYEIISILTEIFYINPKVCPQAISLISLLIEYFNDNDKIYIIDKIKSKIDNIPNNGYLEIWLQRLSFLINKTIKYNEILCKKVELNNSGKLFNFDFLKNDNDKKNNLIKNLENLESFCINKEKIEGLKIPITKSEISIFDLY